jgi:hypothetical protein
MGKRVLHPKPVDLLNAPMGRRRFVRQAGTAVLATAVGYACSESGSPGSGIVSVTINGLGAEVPHGGRVEISGGTLSEPIEIFLPVLAFAEVSVQVGSYTVLYEPPPGYAIVGGQSEFTVDVSEFETTEVEITVSATTGTLRVTVTGITSAINGGSATLQRTDAAGSAIPVIVPLTGTVDRLVAPGTYTVTYAPPTGQELIPGQTNPVLGVVVAQDATTTVTFNIRDLDDPDPPADLLFHSDWSTALGTSDTALRDTSKDGSRLAASARRRL